ncbi:MAG: GNAT family N-acetyltransferase [Planctomycetota bacterium]
MSVRTMEAVAVTLTGRHVRLEPLAERHAEDLAEAGSDAEIWRYMPRAPLTGVADARDYVKTALEAARDGSQVPFAIVSIAGESPAESRASRAIGSTRYLDIRREHRGLEIGWTWLGRAWQRTAANTECKLLLLQHAFEELGALRVQLKTDARNLKSQRAIERIGGVREGVLRAHMVLPDGFVRDTVMYSITAGEWPAARSRLEERLGRRGAMDEGKP